MNEEAICAIRAAVEQVAGIVVAYLPQCFVEGDEKSRQILVLGVRSKRQIPSIIRELNKLLSPLLPTDDFIDILPYPAEKFRVRHKLQNVRFGNQLLSRDEVGNSGDYSRVRSRRF